MSDQDPEVLQVRVMIHSDPDDATSTHLDDESKVTPPAHQERNEFWLSKVATSDRWLRASLELYIHMRFHGCPNALAFKYFGPGGVYLSIQSVAFAAPLFYYGTKFRSMENTDLCRERLATWAIVEGSIRIGVPLLFTAFMIVSVVTALRVKKLTANIMLNALLNAFILGWTVYGAILTWSSSGSDCEKSMKPLWILNTIVLAFNLCGALGSLVAACSPCILLLWPLFSRPVNQQ